MCSHGMTIGIAALPARFARQRHCLIDFVKAHRRSASRGDVCKSSFQTEIVTQNDLGSVKEHDRSWASHNHLQLAYEMPSVHGAARIEPGTSELLIASLLCTET
jgi:hypothetical protein